MTSEWSLRLAESSIFFSESEMNEIRTGSTGASTGLGAGDLVSLVDWLGRSQAGERSPEVSSALSSSGSVEIERTREGIGAGEP